MTEPAPIHVILITHTTRHLRRTLLGAAHQTHPADSVTVSCDVDDDGIRQLLVSVSEEFRLPLTLVRRPHQGASRSAQVRNNAVRALLDRRATDDALLVFLDGDVCPGANVLEQYHRFLALGDLVIGHRIDLTAEQTEAFDETAVRHQRPPAEATIQQLASLHRRHRRYLRALLLRRFGLAKRHKPKLLSANFGVRLSMYRRINGFDEEYQGWGGEDDDFGRRVYLVGGRPVVAVRDLLVYHQHHEQRSATRWRGNPGVRRFLAGGPACCRYGLASPHPQSPVEVISVEERLPANR